MDRRLQQLKNDARREEQRENWVRAIDLYREALRRSEELGSVSLDVSLYNRVGDLHRRLGDAERAVGYYMEAVERYAEQELHTGAVALCNKILRIAPERTGVYRRLGRLHAETGLVAEARKSFEAFAERMRAEGRHAERRDALLELAERIGDRDLLLRVTGEMVEAGEGDAALDALLRALQESPGDEEVRERIRRIEPSALAPAAGPGRAARPAGDGEAPVDLADLLRELDAAEAPDEGGPPPEREPPEAGPDEHVEMGIALYETGRIDDAIRELQRATRAEEPPLRAFEVLGRCFVEKELPSVAVRVLNRALHQPGRAEHELLGVLHRLGAAHQALGQHQRALDCFQRVYAVDIDFRDVSERMREVLLRL